MKRAVALLLTLTLLGAAGLVYAHRVVSASAEAVEVRETVLYGDRAAAEGVEVFFPTESHVHLFWETGLRVGAENVTETAFRFSPEGEWEHWHWSPDPPLALGVSDNVGGDILKPEHELYALVSDVASRAPSGTASSESVRLRDYYEYMPLYVDWERLFSTGEERVFRLYGSDKHMDSAVERQIRRLCAIPVPEDCYLGVNVEKDADGSLLGWSVCPQWGEALELENVTAPAQRGEWFLARLSGGDGQFSCEGCDRLWYIPAGDAAAEPVCALELESGEQARLLEVDALGRPLLLLSRDGESYIRVVDAEGGGCVQTLAVPELDAEDRISRIYTGENFVLAKSVRGHFEMFELTEGGEYVTRLSGELCPPGEDLTYSDRRIMMRWDGQRLAMAVAVFNLDNSKQRQAQGFMLWVYDAEGRDFAALYTSSLSMAEPFAAIGIMSYEGRELSLRLERSGR